MRLYRSPMIRPPFTRVKFNLQDVTPTIQLEFYLVPRALVGGAGKAYRPVDPDQGKGANYRGANYLACRELCAPFPWSGSIG